MAEREPTRTSNIHHTTGVEPASAVPYPMSWDGIGHCRVEEGVDDVGGQLHPLSHRARDNGGCSAGK